DYRNKESRRSLYRCTRLLVSAVRKRSRRARPQIPATHKTNHPARDNASQARTESHHRETEPPRWKTVGSALRIQVRSTLALSFPEPAPATPCPPHLRPNRRRRHEEMALPSRCPIGLA